MELIEQNNYEKVRELKIVKHLEIFAKKQSIEIEALKKKIEIGRKENNKLRKSQIAL